MKIPQDAFEQLYDPLIGNDARQTEFERRLTEFVTEGPFHDSDPYDKLGSGIRSAITWATEEMDDTHQRYAGTIVKNGRLGANLTAATIRTIGDIYTSRVTEPQNPQKVAENTDRALRYTLGLARSDRFSGVLNMECARFGLNPRNPLSLPVAALGNLVGFMAMGEERRAISFRTLTSTVDEDGQLDLRVRYPQRSPKVLERVCPATHARVEVGGAQVSALFTVMRCAGRVAAREIYPYYFPVDGQQPRGIEGKGQNSGRRSGRHRRS